MEDNALNRCMEFKEFVEKEELELFHEAIQLDESLLNVAKGIAGTGMGLLKAGSGAMTIGDEALAKMVGSGTKGRMTRGWKNLGGGLRDAIIGKPSQKPQQQTAPSVPQQQNTPPVPQQAVRQAPQQKVQTRPANQWDKIKSQMDGGSKVKQPDYWVRLVDQYKSAGTRAERDEVARKMRLANPTLFMQAVRRAEAKRKKQAEADSVARSVSLLRTT